MVELSLVKYEPISEYPKIRYWKKQINHKMILILNPHNVGRNWFDITASHLLSSLISRFLLVFVCFIIRALVDMLRHQSSPVQQDERNNSVALTVGDGHGTLGRAPKNLYAPGLPNKDNRCEGAGLFTAYSTVNSTIRRTIRAFVTASVICRGICVYVSSVRYFWDRKIRILDGGV